MSEKGSLLTNNSQLQSGRRAFDSLFVWNNGNKYGVQAIIKK